MIHTRIIFLFAVLSQTILGQTISDTIYLDFHWKKTIKENSTYYRLVEKNSTGLYTCKDFWITGELQMQGKLSELFPETREGEFLWYHKNGTIRQIINYTNNLETGLTKKFDSNGILEIECPPSMDSLDNAKEIKDAIYDFYIYMSKHLKYPRKATYSGIEGSVETTFYIDKNGSITRVKITKSLSDNLDNEALRIINSYKKWPIPIYQGKPTMLYMLFPIVFALD